MTQSYYPNTEQLLAGKRLRSYLLLGWLITVTLLVVGAMTALTYFYPETAPLPVYITGLIAFIVLMLPVLIWKHPQTGIYILFAGALLFPSNPIIPLPTMPTGYVPFWWNLSSSGLYYAHSNSLSAVVISPAEILMLLTFVTWLVRSVVNREFKMERGQFFWGITIYIVMVAFGFLHGVVKNGNTTMALYEVRGQTYFFLAYLMTINLITDVKLVLRLLWTAVICIGLQGICAAFTYLTLTTAVTEDGFMAHDESLFLNLIFFIALLAYAIRLDRRLVFWSLLMVPTALIAVLGNQRRAGIAALMIGFIPLMPILWFILKKQRPHITKICILLGVVASIYMPLAWNAKGVWALPARAIKSQTDPDDRDASSDAYRYAEAFDLKYTRDTSPWIGVGYGHPFIQVMALPKVSTDFLNYMPHNSILWVWMRLGHIGFFAFFLMIAIILIKGAQILKSVTRPELQIVGILGISMLLMLVSFGKFDLALVNCRIMVATAILVGILSILPKLEAGARSDTAVVEPNDGEDFDSPANELASAILPEGQI
jgi:hypothetical protein